MKNKILLTILCAALPSIASASDIRAGNALFSSGKAGIYVKFSPAMPNNKYAVVVQATNTAGYSTVDICTYFNPLKKTASNFQVQHKSCKDGTPIKLDANVSLNWMIMSYQ